MAAEFRLPDIGEGLTEAVIVSWHVAVGEEIDLDAPLVEIETDKAVVDIPSPYAGVLLFQGAAEDKTIEVGTLLAVVGEKGEVWQPEGSGATREAAPAADVPIVGTLEEAPPPAATTSRPQALPIVRKLARDLGVDLDTVQGSGPGGRITEDDVRTAAEGRPTRRVRMSRLRRTIADNLTRSWHEIPHVTTYGEAAAEPLLRAREALGGVPLDALLIARVTPVLSQYPIFNATIDGDEVAEHRYYDVGFAVDTADGLMVAVIRDADRLDVDRLAAEVTRLAEGAKARSLTPDELRGQTFTISNVGALGGRYGTPIIPYGTTAILSVGRADPQPVVRDDRVVVGREFPLSLSYDHRVIDGGTGRRFMAAILDALEAEVA